MYGKPIRLSIKLRNEGEALFLDRIETELPTDTGGPPSIVRHPVNKTFSRNESESYPLEHPAELHIPEGTQQPKLRLVGSLAGVPGVREPDPTTYVVLQNRPVELKVFVSHHMENDGTLASAFAKYARRAGFDVFVAQADRRPSVDMWKEKIEPALDAAKLIVFLWTKDAAASGPVKRELERALAQGKRIHVVVPPGQKPPRRLPRDVEQDRTTPMTIEGMAQLAELLRQNDALGIYT